MKFVFVSHNYSPDIRSPRDWFERIKIYTGSLTCLSKDHSVIRIERINYTGSCLHEGIQYYFGGYGKGKLYFPWAMHRFVASLRPDIVVVSGLHYPWQVLQLHWRLGRRVKIIVQNHAEKPFRGIRKILQRLADRYIDAYFFASLEMGMDWVQKGNLGHAEKIHEIMEVSSVFSPMDKAAARTATGVLGQPVFLWVGRLDENKNPLMVIRTFLQFTRSRPGARLYMIYHTTELLEEIKQLLDEHAAKTRVTGEMAGTARTEEMAGTEETAETGKKTAFGGPGNCEPIVLVGPQPHARLSDWYGSADFIVSGSWYEGSGAAICEAMSCGCIPIATDIFSFRMITGKGRCGLLYKAGDQEALLSALGAAACMDIPLERGKVLDQFRSTLSFEAIAKKMEEIAVSL
jgi:glycosyltransferase involved in cell wall biosynthesis